MKVHQLARELWDQQHEPTSLTLGCKRLRRPLASKLPNKVTIPSFDLKAFIKPHNATTTTTTPPSPNLFFSDEKRDSSPQVETHPGGTRWNPTQEQIGILEMLYRSGTRTPNALQIEQIAAQLGKYGKIEGKNVFYWFQNHKARERQKQKRNSLFRLNHSTKVEEEEEGKEKTGDSPLKRKCRSLTMERCRSEEGDGTLELFPLRPEGRL